MLDGRRPCRAHHAAPTGSLPVLDLLASFENAGCPEFFHIVVVAVGTAFYLPRIVQPAVQET
jgi:hypothetical protein